jgi:hypothetical protein
MKRAAWPLLFLSPLVLSLGLASSVQPLQANESETRGVDCWKVADVRAGMKGFGRTVMKGTKVETFQVAVLGVLENTSPGRDLILCRLSGLGLEKTGVIAGMSGSPVYLDGKLLGAVAYAWSHGTEPIAGITPFAQMVQFVAAHEKRQVAERSGPRRVGLRAPLHIGGQHWDAITVSQDFTDPPGDADRGLWLRPLRTPLTATGFSPRAIRLLGQLGASHGLVPMQGGGVSPSVAREVKEVALEPGGPLAVALITGDFDLSGIGTVTHIQGDRVYGWGHPFMSLGTCSFPLMTGYIHTVYPRRTVSFKMGSPLRAVGIVHADVSTCIAGRLGEEPDLLPVRMEVALGEKEKSRVFQVRVAREPTMLSNLVYTALVNAVDMEGDLPEEVTAQFRARINIKGHDPLILEDTFSGSSGRRTPPEMYGEVARAITRLTRNSYQPLVIEGIDCHTRILSGRVSARIESAEADSEVYAPGDTVHVTVYLRPFKQALQAVQVSLKLPPDLGEGRHTLTVCSEPASTRLTMQDIPELDSPRSIDKILQGLHLRAAARQTRLALRLPLGTTGVALAEQSLDNLPGSMVHILSKGRRSGARSVRQSLVSLTDTDWVIEGSEKVSITISKQPRYHR